MRRAALIAVISGVALFWVFQLAAFGQTQVEAEKPAGTSQKASDWPTFRGDASSTGVARSSLPEKLEILWERQIPKNNFASTPCVVEVSGRKVAVLSSGNGPIIALDLQTGEPIWQYEGPIGFIGSVSFKDGKFYVGDVEGKLYCLDSAGKEVWKFTAEASIDSSPNFFGDKVLVTSQDSYFYCLKADSGELVWKLAAGDQLRSTPTVAGERAFAAGCDGFLHIINLADGSEAGSVEITSPTGCTPAVLGDAIFFGTEQSGFFAINWRESKLLWNYNKEDAPISIRGNAAVIDGHVLIGTTQRQLMSLSPADGKVQWTAKLKANVESSAVVVGQRVFIGANNGVLYEYNWKDGQLLNSYEFNGGLTGSAAVGFERLVIATDRGFIYCLGAK
jgi:outer membrane protein assembly factor BamB